MDYLAMDSAKATRVPSPAESTVGMLENLVERAQRIASRADEMFVSVVTPEPPSNAKEVACVDKEKLPPLFVVIQNHIDSVHRQLNRIESLVERCGL